MPSKSCFTDRLNKLRFQCKKEGVDGCIIDHPVDLLYLTGLTLSLGRLVVTAKGATLFVDGRYLEVCQREAPVAVEESSPKAVTTLLKRYKKIGFDSSTTTVDQQKKLALLVPNTIIPLSQPLKMIRAIKDAHEISAMRASARLLWKGFIHARSQLRVGVREEELALEFEIFCRRQGASALAFDPIIAFGENSAMPHHRSGRRRLKRGDLVLIDIGVELNHYRSDMTRCVHFGAIDSRLAKMEKVVLDSHSAALKLCKPGTKLKKLDEAARKVMRAAKLEDLYVHSLGHGIGLETHEFPRIRYTGEEKDVALEAGMVITIEPGLYLPGVGGIRHEDTIVIQPRGYKNFYA